jgi:hypothetical protein
MQSNAVKYRIIELLIIINKIEYINIQRTILGFRDSTTDSFTSKSNFFLLYKYNHFSQTSNWFDKI